jgi:hypothetical protein
MHVSLGLAWWNGDLIPPTLGSQVESLKLACNLRWQSSKAGPGCLPVINYLGFFSCHCPFWATYDISIFYFFHL